MPDHASSGRNSNDGLQIVKSMRPAWPGASSCTIVIRLATPASFCANRTKCSHFLWRVKPFSTPCLSGAEYKYLHSYPVVPVGAAAVTARGYAEANHDVAPGFAAPPNEQHT